MNIQKPYLQLVEIAMAPDILVVNNLSLTSNSVVFFKDVSFTLKSGRTLAIIGETGCGKSLLCKSLIGLQPPGFEISGSILFYQDRSHAIEITEAAESTMSTIRGSQIGFVFQEATASFNPLLSCGMQVFHVLRSHDAGSKDTLKQRTLALLEQVGFSDADRIYRCYPHQLSGGMAQRVSLALALAGEPQILIADEPSFALDSVAKKEYLQLIKDLCSKINLSLILVTHDIQEAFSYSDDILVLYAGCPAEIISNPSNKTIPSHPYTQALLNIAKAFQNFKLPQPIPGEVPSITSPPRGCRFHPRCNRAQPICRESYPEKRDLGSNHFVWCFFPDLEN
jgi:peptide/nickel transport system ATP-binding protein